MGIKTNRNKHNINSVKLFFLTVFKNVQSWSIVAIIVNLYQNSLSITFASWQQKALLCIVIIPLNFYHVKQSINYVKWLLWLHLYYTYILVLFVSRGTDWTMNLMIEHIDEFDSKLKINFIKDVKMCSKVLNYLVFIF